MKNLSNLPFIALLMLALSLQCCTSGDSRSASTTAGTKEYYSMADFNKVEKYDTHVHLNTFDSTFIKQAEKDHFRLITVNVSTPHYPPVPDQQKIAQALVKAFPKRLKYSTTFMLDDWGTRKWEPQVLSYLESSFKHGAIAVKIWKNIGMALQDKNGKFVMIDDPRFDPVLDFIEKNNITVIAHLGEPRNAWLPLDSMTIEGDKTYYSEHPEYHMYKHPDFPSYADEIRARDHMLQKHPHLRVVGAHLGSLEWNVDELAKRLDQFPNFAIDLAARTVHLQYQSVKNRQKVRDFMIKYQDRIVYGTDEGIDSKSDVVELNKSLHENRLRDWAYFATDSLMHTDEFKGAFKGLKLPKVVVNKIYRNNAKHWFSGLE